jgi:sporulation protein YlmC with PRC-barrel domain
MASHDTTGSTTGAAGAAQGATSHLGRLNDLSDFKVADGFPDPRGWDVKTTDGQTVGKVGDLIVDTQQMRVRYVDVELERSVGELARDAATPGDQERHTLLPIGSVELDDARDDVRVSGYTLEQIAGLPRYGGQTISRDYERSLVDRHRTRGVGATVAGAAAAAGAAVSHGAEKVKDAVTGDRHADARLDAWLGARLRPRRLRRSAPVRGPPGAHAGRRHTDGCRGYGRHAGRAAAHAR